MKGPRKDCNWCHGKGIIKYQKFGEPLNRKKEPEERPCFCLFREKAPLTGKKGRRNWVTISEVIRGSK